MIRGIEHDGVTIGRSFGDAGTANHPARATTVLYNNVLT